MKNKRVGSVEQEVKVPAWIQILGWLISLSAFAVGFWHAHLGLKQFGFLSSQYGSFVIAGLILMVLIVAYNRAMLGVKSAIYFYLICALFMFIFNMNSFYPTYLGEKLIKEDASAMKDTLTKYTAKLKGVSEKQDGSTIKTIGILNDIKESLLNEIEGTGINDFGPKAQGFLIDFNRMAGSDLSSGSETIGTSKDLAAKKNRWRSKLDAAIRNWYIASNPNLKNGAEIITANLKLDSVNKAYAPLLENIMTDTATIDLSNPSKLKQVVTMGQAASQFDIIGKGVNEFLAKKDQLPKLNDEVNQVAFPPTKELGRFAHTISSVKQRINKIDTWGIIILCLFIDIVVPLAIYFMLRGNKNNEEFTSVFKGRKRNFTHND
ncbi:hypothetical protein U8695_07445 [Aquirufa antheringensis]